MPIVYTDPESSVHFLPLDLGSLASVRQTAGQFFAQWNKLDMLINNAGIAAAPLRYTPMALNCGLRPTFWDTFS